MRNPGLYIILFGLITATSCVKKPEEMTGPTIGTLMLEADESIKDIISQEEDIFERTYKYAHLNINYSNEYDIFRRFFADSTHVIITTRGLNPEEASYFTQKNVTPRVYPFATGAIALISNTNSPDTVYTYEDMIGLLGSEKSGKVFVVENAKSGISNYILKLVNKPALPSHIYALSSKKDVLDYVQTHDHAIGIIDYSDISDSDNPLTKQVLSSIHLLAISRPVDSIQAGFIKPYQYNLQDHKYPFTRELYVISKTGQNDVGMGFASFISGDIGQKIILKAGLLPKFQTERYIEFNETSDIKVVK